MALICVDCSTKSALCGNGIVDPGEDCDDGNDTDNGNGCSAACQRVGTCGDGIVQVLFERCDDGNDDNTDACLNDCREARCGDGFVQRGVEACDDGNDVPDDGCDLRCFAPDAGFPRADAGSDGGEVDGGPFVDAGQDAGAADAGQDASTDADSGLGPGIDSGIDAGVDAGIDAGIDAGVDAGTDAGVDAGIDAGIDAGVDAGIDAGTALDAGLTGMWADPTALGCVSTTCTPSFPGACCNLLPIPGGTFQMGRSENGADSCPSYGYCIGEDQPEHTATVSAFSLDAYEVTVGRFRRFVDVYDGVPPAAGAGAHPKIPGSGWKKEWNYRLPGTSESLNADVSCGGINAPIWTATPGENEALPMHCVNFQEAFAFCLWEGARLPTEAEWEFAAAGGEENRLYPWGNDVPVNGTNASFGWQGWGVSPPTYTKVGSYAPSRWGQYDLAGNVSEWVIDFFDWNVNTYQAPCSDCAVLTGSDRLARGGNWDSGADLLRSAYREHFPVTTTYPPFDYDPRGTYIGFRCAK